MTKTIYNFDLSFPNNDNPIPNVWDTYQDIPRKFRKVKKITLLSAEMDLPNNLDTYVSLYFPNLPSNNTREV